MKLAPSAQIAVGYFAKKIADRKMTPSREFFAYGKGKKKQEVVHSVSCWQLFSDFVEGLGYEPVEDGDWTQAEARIRSIIADAT